MLAVMRASLLSFLALGLLFTASCGGDTASSNDSQMNDPTVEDAGLVDTLPDGGASPGLDRICEPGETQRCQGPGACDGAQSCDKDGARWEACDCGASPSTGGENAGGMGSGGEPLGAGGMGSGGGPLGSGGMGTGGGGPFGSGGMGTGGEPLGAGGTGGGWVDTCDESENNSAGTDLLITDFETESDALPPLGNRSGHWYTYHDGSFGGVMVPQPGTDAVPTASSGRNGTSGLVISSSGFEEWGSGFGVGLNVVGRRNCRHDISSAEGIEFWMRTVDASEMRIRFGIQQMGGGDDLHGMSIDVTGTWQKFQIPFAQMAQEGWGTPTVFTGERATDLRFLFRQSLTVHLVLDDLALYGPDVGDP